MTAPADCPICCPAGWSPNVDQVPDEDCPTHGRQRVPEAGTLHTTLREVVEIGRRGGYDSDEIAEKLALVVRNHAIAERNRTLSDARAVVVREVNAYPDASPAITSGIWGGFDQWAVSQYGTLSDPDRRLCGTCGQRHTQYEHDDAHRNDEGGY